RRLDAHGVVEVARGLGVDGHEAAIAEVDAVGEILGPHQLRRALGGAGDVVGELGRDVADDEDLLDLGARIVGIAEDVDDARRDRLVGFRGIARDLGDHGLSVLGAAGGSIEEHVAAGGADARIVGLDEAGAALLAQGAGELGAAALEDLLDAALGALVAEPGGDGDAIAVHRRAAVAAGDVDVVLAVVARDEAVAGGVDAQGAGDPALRQRLARLGGGRRRADDAVAVAGRLFEDALVDQVVEERTQAMPTLDVGAHDGGQLVRAQAFVRPVAQGLQYILFVDVHDLSFWERTLSVKRVQGAVVVADVDGAVGADGGRGVDVAVEEQRPQELAVGGDGVEAIVFGADDDVAGGVDDRRADDAIGGAEAPRHHAARLDRVERAVEAADVDGAVGGDGGRAADGAAGGDRPAQHAAGAERVELVVVAADVDDALGGDGGRAVDVVAGAEVPALLPVGADGVEGVVAAADVDGAVEADGGCGRAVRADAGRELPLELDVGRQGVEPVGGGVHGAVGGDGDADDVAARAFGADAGGDAAGAGGELPAHGAVGEIERVEPIVVAAGVDHAAGAKRGRAPDEIARRVAPLDVSG